MKKFKNTESTQLCRPETDLEKQDELDVEGDLLEAVAERGDLNEPDGVEDDGAEDHGEDVVHEQPGVPCGAGLQLEKEENVCRIFFFYY